MESNQRTGRTTRSSISRVTTASNTASNTASSGTNSPSTPTHQGRPRQTRSIASSLPSPSLSPEAPAKTKMPTPPPPSRREVAAHADSPRSSNTSSSSDRASLPPPPPAPTPIPTPVTATMGSRSKDASGMPSPPHHEHSFFAQNRAILLSGLPNGLPICTPQPIHANENSPSASPSTQTPLQAQASPASRLGRNARKTAVDRLAPLVTRGSAGPATDVLFSPSMQSPRVVSACIYVKAVDLNSQGEPSPRSGGSSEDGDALVKREEDDYRMRKQSIVSMASTVFSTVSVPTLEEGQIYICAYVRPSSADRKPYAIHRVCDRNELARSVPKPDGRAASSVSILPSPLLPPQSPFFSPASPSPVGNHHGHHPGHPALATESRRQSLGPGAGIKRRTSPSPLSPESPMPPHLRRHSLLAHHRRQSSAKEASPDQFLTGDGIPIPMRPHPALGMLPGLAAVVLSGRVHAGDLIEQPLPHPMAWPETVSYVYKGYGEVTEAIKQNIEHLGGRLEQ